MSLASLLRFRQNDIIVADMGCGEARLAKSVKQKVYSFDLVAINKRVTACDMANVSSIANYN